MTKMSNLEYVRHAGNHCPFCNDDNVETGVIQADGRDAWADASCPSCKESWRDLYRLVGFAEVEKATA